MQKSEPTYSAEQVKEMAMSFDMEYDSFKVLVDVIEEEMDLYTEEDLVVLMSASMIMFSRSMMQLTLKYLG